MSSSLEGGETVEPLGQIVMFRWLKNLFPPRKAASDELARAIALIDAIDQGGMPLNTARVNAIARDLGLEVSRKAPPEETILRIRQAIARRK